MFILLEIDFFQDILEIQLAISRLKAAIIDTLHNTIVMSLDDVVSPRELLLRRKLFKGRILSVE